MEKKGENQPSVYKPYAFAEEYPSVFVRGKPASTDPLVKTAQDGWTLNTEFKHWDFAGIYYAQTQLLLAALDKCNAKIKQIESKKSIDAKTIKWLENKKACVEQVHFIFKGIIALPRADFIEVTLKLDQHKVFRLNKPPKKIISKDNEALVNLSMILGRMSLALNFDTYSVGEQHQRVDEKGASYDESEHFSNLRDLLIDAEIEPTLVPALRKLTGSLLATQGSLATPLAIENVTERTVAAWAAPALRVPDTKKSGQFIPNPELTPEDYSEIYLCQRDLLKATIDYWDKKIPAIRTAEYSTEELPKAKKWADVKMQELTQLKAVLAAMDKDNVLSVKMNDEKPPTLALVHPPQSALARDGKTIESPDQRAAFIAASTVLERMRLATNFDAKYFEDYPHWTDKRGKAYDATAHRETVKQLFADITALNGSGHAVWNNVFMAVCLFTVAALVVGGLLSAPLHGPALLPGLMAWAGPVTSELAKLAGISAHSVGAAAMTAAIVPTVTGIIGIAGYFGTRTTGQAAAVDKFATSQSKKLTDEDASPKRK